MIERILIETDKCSLLLRRWSKDYLIKIKFRFQTDATMRINLTFTKFKLIKKEFVQFMNFDKNMRYATLKESSPLKQVTILIMIIITLFEL